MSGNNSFQTVTMKDPTQKEAEMRRHDTTHISLSDTVINDSRTIKYENATIFKLLIGLKDLNVFCKRGHV